MVIMLQIYSQSCQNYKSLKSMMNSTNTVIGSTSMANSGKHQILASISLFTKDLSRAWILDAGATDHMTSSEKCFESYEILAPGKNVQTVDGTLLPVVGFGSMKMQPIGTIINVLNVPKLFINLISIQRLASLREYNILFDDVDAYLCHKELRWKIGLAKVQHGLYYLPCQSSRRIMETEPKVAAVKTSSEEEIMDVHQRMGHPSFYLLKHMYPHLFKNIDISTTVCDACQLGKFKRTTFPPTDHRKTSPFQLIHLDVWGPSSQTDVLGKRYFLVCTDDYSRYSWIFLLKEKTEVTPNIKNLCKLIKRQFGEDIKGIRTDNARDFLNTELKEFLESEGIKHETSCPYTPQQNGLVERKIRDTVDKSRTLLIQGNVPINLWGFAVMTAMHLINRLPSKVLYFRSPIHLLEECFPNIKLKTSLPVKAFGRVCYVHNPKYKQNKWNAKALKCVFLGYSTTQKGYKGYHHLTQKYIVSKDILFEEKLFYYKPIGNESHREIDRLLISENTLINDFHLLSDSSPLVGAKPNTELGSELPQISHPTDTNHPPNQADDTHTIVPYPKYYQRKKGKKPVESNEITVPNENNNPVISGESLESAEGGDVSNQNRESLSFEQGGDDFPIALRKGTRTCVKPIPFAMATYLNYQKV